MTLPDWLRALRERSEYELRLSAMEDVGRRFPEALVRKAAMPRGGPFWRLVFVPLYRRVPWHVKHRAMQRLRMTSQGWNTERRFQEPWRPPPR
jgi:hypothetical protein